MRKEIVIRSGDAASFRNLTDYCVGTGRVDLALHKSPSGSWRKPSKCR